MKLCPEMLTCELYMTFPRIWKKLVIESKHFISFNGAVRNGKQCDIKTFSQLQCFYRRQRWGRQNNSTLIEWTQGFIKHTSMCFNSSATRSKWKIYYQQHRSLWPFDDGSQKDCCCKPIRWLVDRIINLTTMKQSEPLSFDKYDVCLPGELRRCCSQKRENCSQLQHFYAFLTHSS